MDQRLDGWDVSLDAPLKEDSDTERIEFMSRDPTSARGPGGQKRDVDLLLNKKLPSSEPR
jgi:RNA polymerase sigma-32 factor